MPIEVSRKILERLKRLRETGLRVRRENFPHENLRESHARELITRAVILPQLKASFGRRLKAVLLTGSSQLGVRKASMAHEKSDIDVVVAVSRQSALDIINDFVSPCDKLAEAIREIAGCPCQIMPVFDTNFQAQRYALKAPFQVIYGKPWIVQQLNADHLNAMSLERDKMALKEKYRPKEFQRSIKNPL